MGGRFGFGSLFRLDITPDSPSLTLVSSQNRQLTLTWNASIGRNYQIQSCASIVQAAWTNLGVALPATNTTMSFLPAFDAAKETFFRVILLP
jgi:hypothetical protein